MRVEGICNACGFNIHYPVILNKRQDKFVKPLNQKQWEYDENKI